MQPATAVVGQNTASRDTISVTRPRQLVLLPAAQPCRHLKSLSNLGKHRQLDCHAGSRWPSVRHCRYQPLATTVTTPYHACCVTCIRIGDGSHGLHGVEGVSVGGVPGSHREASLTSLPSPRMAPQLPNPSPSPGLRKPTNCAGGLSWPGPGRLHSVKPDKGSAGVKLGRISLGTPQPCLPCRWVAKPFVEETPRKYCNPSTALPILGTSPGSPRHGEFDSSTGPGTILSARYQCIPPAAPTPP